MGFNRPCLDCGQLVAQGNRCATHQAAYIQRIHSNRKEKRDHYKGNYKARSKVVRDNAQICWICKEGYKPNDPWTADHYFPGIPDSPLLPAHRTCNSKRKNKNP